MGLSGIRGVTLDFGNTLVPIDRAALRSVVERTAERACRHLDLGDPADFLEAWANERDRQFREAVPEFREVDLPERAMRVLARLRGSSPPAASATWDDAAARTRSTDLEVGFIVDAYSAAFVAGIPAPEIAGRVIRALATGGFTVAILSNWPLAATIDQFAVAAGWAAHLDGIFVSERIGTIKPHPAIFRHVEERLAIAPGHLLHVGDDWAADVVGARRAGWHAAYLADAQADTPLPTSDRADDVMADAELDHLDELVTMLDDAPAMRAGNTTA